MEENREGILVDVAAEDFSNHHVSMANGSTRGETPKQDTGDNSAVVNVTEMNVQEQNKQNVNQFPEETSSGPTEEDSSPTQFSTRSESPKENVDNSSELNLKVINVPEHDAANNNHASEENSSGKTESTTSIPLAQIPSHETGWAEQSHPDMTNNSAMFEDTHRNQDSPTGKANLDQHDDTVASTASTPRAQKWSDWMRFTLSSRATNAPKKGILVLDGNQADRKKTKRTRRVHFQLKKRRNQAFHLLCTDSTFLERWWMVMVVATAYEIWAFPYRLALADEANLARILVADGVCDLLFVFDMCIQMITRVPANTYPDQDEPLVHPVDIAKLYMRYRFPYEILPSFLYYIISAIFLPRCANGICWAWWLVTIPRMAPRALRLVSYFRSKECDLKVSVRALQGVKFSLILFLSAHWVGCIFYWLARLQNFRTETWVADFENLLPKFSRDESVEGERYLLCLYKGFNSLSNLEYDLGMPLNPVEMVWSIIVMGFQVYMSALILGTLLNYLVAKDPAGEAHKKRLDKVAQFCEAKGLPDELQSRIYQYLHFQFEKNVQNKAAFSVVLPKSLAIKVADSKYRSILDKCSLKGGCLHACDANFLNAMLVKLNVVHLMPAEEFVAQHGIPRELFFVLEGTVQVLDRENRILRVIRGDVPDMAPVCGEVPFFLGINHHNSIRAQPNGSVQLLVLSREDFEELVLAYPIELEQIHTNILAAFNLDINGEDLEGGQDDGDTDRDRLALRENIISSIKRRAQERFAALVFAAASGDLQTVSALARQGVDVNEQDYDGRTVLHVAAADGNYKLVEMLLDMGADKNLKNRWGSTPLAEAINNRQVLIIGLLCQWKAALGVENPAGLLCQAASTGDIEVVRRLVENNVDPNTDDYDGRSALHIAAAEGQDKVTEYLLSQGADPNCEDRWGGKPLLDAVKGAHTVLAGLLRAKGAQLPEGIGAEQVCAAAGKGDVRQLRLLHECGESVEVGDYDARFPLHLAAAEARILAVSYLLGISADPNCTDRWGGTPLDDALRGDCTTYHLYCAKLIAGWGGKLGVLAGTAEGEEKMRELEKIDITEVRNLIKKLINKGYDNCVMSRQTPEELTVATDTTIRHIPLVADMFARTQALRSLLEENSESCADGIETLKDSVMQVAKALDANRNQRHAARRASLTGISDVLGTSPLGGWSRTQSMGTEQSVQGLFGRNESAVESPSNKSGVDSPTGRGAASPVNSMSMSMMVQSMLAKLSAAEAERADEQQLEQEFVDDMDSDEEAALHAEIDQLLEAQERAQRAGLRVDKVAANAFQKTAIGIMEVGYMFETLCRIVSKASVTEAAQTTETEPWLSIDDVQALLDVLGADSMSQIDLEDLFEEALRFHHEFVPEGHKNHRGPAEARLQAKQNAMALKQQKSFVKASKSSLSGSKGNLSGSKSVLHASRKAMGPEQESDMTVPISSLLAGSPKLRRLLQSIPFDRDLCFLMDTRLSALMDEDKVRSLLPCKTYTVPKGSEIYASASSDGQRWYVLQDGEMEMELKDESKKRPIYSGEFFGAYSALRGALEKAQHYTVKATKECKVAELSTRNLVQAINAAKSLRVALTQLMPETKLLSADKNSEVEDTGGVSKKMLKRAVSKRNFVPIRGAGLGGAGGKDEVEDLTVKETEKRMIREMVKQIEHMWSSFCMGSSSVPRKQLYLVHGLLGEVSSELFKTMFFSRQLPSTIAPEIFWQCWVDFLSDEYFGDGTAKPDLMETPIAVLAAENSFDPNAEEQPEQVAPLPLHDESDDENEGGLQGLFERLHASLAHRFFEDETLDMYESVWHDVVGDTARGMAMDKIPQFLTRLCTDFGYRITERNIKEFLSAFGLKDDNSKTINYEDIHKVIREQKLGMGDVVHGPFVGSALNPTWPALARWRSLIRLCAVYYIVVVPVRVGFLPFDRILHPTALLSDGLVDILVILNLLCQLNTAYKNRNQKWVTNRVKILRKVHIATLVAAFPFDWFAFAFGASNEAFGFLRFGKVLLILGCGKPSKGQQSATREKIEFMAKLLAIIIHWSTCFWFYLGRSYGHWYPVDDVSWYIVDDSVAHLTYERDTYGMDSSATFWDQYLLSLYWVCATITVNGLTGDVIPQNLVEVIFTIFLMCLNLTVVRWVLGEVSTIIMSADNEIVKQREELELVDSFIAGNNLAPDLQVEIRNHFHSAGSGDGSHVDQSTILPMLSHSLAVEVASFCAREFLKDVEIFKGTSDRLLDTMCVLLSEVFLEPQQWVFHESENASEMFIIMQGGVEECSEGSEVVVDNILRAPSSVGELAFFFGTRHYLSARATMGGASVLTMKKESFDSLLKLFPEEYEVISQNALRVMERVSNRRGAASSKHSRNSRNSRRTGSKRSASSKGGSFKSASAAGSVASNSFRSRGSQSQASGPKPLEDVTGNAEADGEGSEDDNNTISSGQSRQDQVNSEIDGFEGGASGKGGKIAELKAKRKNEKVHALLSACMLGDLAAVKKELESGAVMVNDTDMSKRSALHVACSAGHKKVVEYLLSKGADLSLKDKFGNTPLNDAVRERKDVAARVIREWAPGTTVVSKGKAAAVEMCEAAFAGDLTHIRRLLINGVSINDSEYDGRTALHLAACEGHVDMVKYLLEHKAMYDVQDRFGGTPIQDAVRHGKKEVQALLYAKGARLETGGKDFSVKLCEAAAEGDLETIRTLSNNGVDIGAGDYDGRTALHLAAANEKVAVLEFLLNREPAINVNPVDRFFDTPIGDAMRHERPTATSMLAQKGGLQKGNPELVKVLADQQAADEKRRKAMREPLVEAALQYSPEQRALAWLENRLEPTMKEKTLSLVQAMDALQRELYHLTLDMTDAVTQRAVAKTVEALADRRKKPGSCASAKLQSPWPGESQAAEQVAVLPGAVAVARQSTRSITLLKNLKEEVRNGQVGQKKEKKRRAEEILEQIREVKGSVIDCISVLEGGGAMDDAAPIECRIWKSASRQYATEAKKLRKQLRSMSDLCKVARKLMKELIKVEDRKVHAALYAGARSPLRPRLESPR